MNAEELRQAIYDELTEMFIIISEDYQAVRSQFGKNREKLVKSLNSEYLKQLNWISETLNKLDNRPA